MYADKDECPQRLRCTDATPTTKFEHSAMVRSTVVPGWQVCCHINIAYKTRVGQSDKNMESGEIRENRIHDINVLNLSCRIKQMMLQLLHLLHRSLFISFPLTANCQDKKKSIKPTYLPVN